MEGKICLISGANKGLGKETCLKLAAMGAEVVMTARNQEQAQQVRNEIISATGNDKVHLIVSDLSSFSGIISLESDFREKFSRLDVLVNNAGIFLTEYLEADGRVETQWMVNYLAPYLLTRRMLDLLKKAPEGRIINVSSNAHFRGKIMFDDLNHKANYNGFAAYSQSKLGNVLFTKALANQLAGSRVSVFSLHPGVVRTDIGNKNSKGWMSWLWRLGKPFMISPSKGAETIVYLASHKQIAGLNGLYFVRSQPHPSSPLSNDRDLANKLWKVSEEQVKSYL